MIETLIAVALGVGFVSFVFRVIDWLTDYSAWTFDEPAKQLPYRDEPTVNGISYKAYWQTKQTKYDLEYLRTINKHISYEFCCKCGRSRMGAEVKCQSFYIPSHEAISLEHLQVKCSCGHTVKEHCYDAEVSTWNERLDKAISNVQANITEFESKMPAELRSS